MDNKVILITGSRTGIGRSLAEYYLKKGLNVAGCSRGENDLEHEKYIHFQLDVGDEKAVVAMIAEVVKNYGKIDYLINNAGAASMNHLLLTPMNVVENLYNANFLGTFLFTREVAKQMVSRKFGRIVNFTSIASRLAIEGEAIYASMKSAIGTFTQVAAKELYPFGICCNAIAPGLVKTRLTDSVPKAKMDSLLDQTTAKKMTEMKDLYHTINFLISEESDMITGQIFDIGG
jgi:3-oxoacyl-[acyl-carrier protein] reductase